MTDKADLPGPQHADLLSQKLAMCKFFRRMILENFTKSTFDQMRQFCAILEKQCLRSLALILY
jgi:hypothetical protein